MAFLHTPWRRRHFALPSFDPSPLEFGPEFDEPPARSAPQAGQLREPAGRHLCAMQDSRPLDAAAELRQALSQLRRSLR
jgi:hypothetical protein